MAADPSARARSGERCGEQIFHPTFLPPVSHLLSPPGSQRAGEVGVGSSKVRKVGYPQGKQGLTSGGPERRGREVVVAVRQLPPFLP